MNIENSEASDPHRLLLNLSDKREVIHMLNYQTSVYTMHGKI